MREEIGLPLHYNIDHLRNKDPHKYVQKEMS